MNKNQLNQLEEIIATFYFSDGSSVKQRASKIVQKNSNLGFSIDISNILQAEAEKIRAELIVKLKQLKLFKQITIILTQNKQIINNQQEKPKILIENIRKIIVIAAGKGGVGKSTMTALLAHKLKQAGKKVAIIDADIYGPSIPNIFNLSGKPKLQDNKMLPLSNYGIKVNSIGFLAQPSQAISWRGPMVSKALYQLLSLTCWGELDYLLIDTPPGTGDIHLSLLQNYQIDQALIVVTPSKLARLDVIKTIDLYRKFNINIAGIIENMSYYQDTPNSQKIPIFAGQSGLELAKYYQLKLLAQIPINPLLAKNIDEGKDLTSMTYLFNNFTI